MDPRLLSALREGKIDHLRAQALCRDDPTQLYRMTVKGNSILHIAASHHCLWFIIQELNPANRDLLFHQNENGDTWMHCAVRARKDVFRNRPIINHGWGLMIGLLNKRGDAALHEAARCGRAHAVRMLLEAGPNMAAVLNNDGESPVYLAAVKGSVEAVRILLGCETVEYGGPRGKTALHAAVCRSYDIANMLLEKKPELNHQVDTSQSAPIHYAASLGDVNMVSLLLQKDASVAYCLDNAGLSAMHIAASMNYPNMIEEIVHQCPDATELTDFKGNNFFHVAIKERAMAVVKLVLRNPLFRQSLNERDLEGNTPLHLAVINHNTEIVYLLLSNNEVDTNVTNRDGFTPSDLAASSSDPSIHFRMNKISEKLTFAGSNFVPKRMDLIMVKDQGRMTDEELNRYEKLAYNLGLVAILITTVTFAAAYTLPGGYINDDSNQEEGMAILAKKVAFKVFLISDTVALLSSICVTWLLIDTGSLDHDIRCYSVINAMNLVWIALGGMVIAFAMGIYVVLVSKCRWLAILICGATVYVPIIAWTINWSAFDSVVAVESIENLDYLVGNTRNREYLKIITSIFKNNLRVLCHKVVDLVKKH